MRRRPFLAGAASLPLLQRTSSAQDPASGYPSGPIRIVVPFAAGSATDNAARTVADGLSKRWGQSVVVDNRAGANGFIAAEMVAKSKPDGLTIFIASNTALASNVALFKTLPYDPLRDFQPVTSLGFAPTFLLVHPAVPARTAQELVAFAKARPGTLNFGSGSASTRISGEMLKSIAGIDLVHVPYKSTPLALNDLMAGHIQLMFADPVTATPQIRAGTVRCLGVATRGRYRLTPEIPTLIEQGLADLELETWTAAAVPAGTPRPVVDKIRAAIVETVADPAYVARMAQQGSDIRPSTPEQLRELQVREIELYRRLMKIAGIDPE